MVKIVKCCQEIKQSPSNLMIKQSFVTLSGTQWDESQIMVYLNGIYKKIDAANRMLSFIYSFNVHCVA